MAKLDWVKFRDRARLRQERDQAWQHNKHKFVRPRRGISPDAPLCPRCGAYMLKRTSRFGPFWGCSQFPRCRGTQKKAESDPARG